MPEPLIWSLPRDLQLHRMRAEGASWDEIAVELRVSRWSVIERGRKIGAHKPDLAQAEPQTPALPDLSREPLAAGHAVSWGALIAHTILDGQLYPWPPLSHGG